MAEACRILREVLGLNRVPQELDVVQITLRGILVFVAAIVLVRVANKRFLARMTAFDVILGFILGSMLARAINGSAPLFPSLGAALALILFHRLIALLARHSHWVSTFVKGSSEVLIENGRILQKPMKRNQLSEQDVEEELRLEAHLESARDVKRAIIERSGNISVIPK